MSPGAPKDDSWTLTINPHFDIHAASVHLGLQQEREVACGVGIRPRGLLWGPHSMPQSAAPLNAAEAADMRTLWHDLPGFSEAAPNEALQPRGVSRSGSARSACSISSRFAPSSTMA